MAITTEYFATDVRTANPFNGKTAGDQTGSEIVNIPGTGRMAVVYKNEGGNTLGDYPAVTFYNSAISKVSTFELPYKGFEVDMIGDPEIVALANGNVAVVWKEGSGASDSV